MKDEIFTDNALGALTSSLTSVETVLTLQVGEGLNFPDVSAPDFSILALVFGNTYEKVKLTSKLGDSLTVTRAQQGTTAQNFGAGARVFTISSSDTMQELSDNAVLNNNNEGNTKGVNSLNIQSGRTLSDNVSSGLNSMTLGYDTKASGQGSTAIGDGAQATLKDSYNMSGINMIRADKGESAADVQKFFTGSESFIFSKIIDLTQAAIDNVVVINLPANSHFFPSQVGIVITEGVGVGLAPSVSFGDISSSQSLAITATVTQSNSYDLQSFPLLPKRGQTELTASLKTAATATSLKARFYFKGFLLED